MNDERTRILRMLAEGTISVEECEELLRALSDRKAEKVERDVREATESRANWPYVLLAILGLIWALSWLRGDGIFRFHFPARVSLVFLLGAAFWVWMLIDCITRQPDDFKLMFTKKHEHDKWIWCGVILLASWVGALVYFICVHRPTRRTARPVDPVTKTPVDPYEGYTPSPPAKSLWRFILLGILLAIIAFGLPILSNVYAQWVDSRVPFMSGGILGMSFKLVIPVIAIWLAIFWIWMLVDCLARDFRDFGTLVVHDRSLDKVLWVLLILFTSIIGALAYHLSVRRRVRKLPGEKTPPEKKASFSQSERKSPLPTLLVVGLIVFLVVVVPSLLARFAMFHHSLRRFGIPPARRFSFALESFSPLALLAAPVLLFLIFWAWMLIDCIARDYRDFGTLISSDKSLDKLVWVLLLLFTSALGALAYYLAVYRRPRTAPDTPNQAKPSEYAKNADRTAET